jgi:hypothetical protein
VVVVVVLSVSVVVDPSGPVLVLVPLLVLVDVLVWTVEPDGPTP